MWTVLTGGDLLLCGSARNQWPSRCHVWTSLAAETRVRITIGSPTCASSTGVAGSPCSTLLNSSAGSPPLGASGSTLRFSELPLESPAFVSGVAVLYEHDQLSETSCHVGRHHTVGMHICDGAAAYLLAGVRVVVGRPGRLGDEGAEQAVLPRCERPYVVMEVGGAELDVRVPAVTHELGAYHLTGVVSVLEGLLEHQLVAFNGLYAAHLERVRLIHAHPDEDAGLETGGVA